MGSVDTKIRPDHDGIPEETATAVRRAVAHYAAGQPGTEQARGQIFAQLLDILGLSGEATCDRCGKSMSRPDASGNYRPSGAGGGLCWQCAPKAAYANKTARCACGGLAQAATGKCRTCTDFVPVAQVEVLVQRIQYATGMSVYKIADAAGVVARSLSSAMTPSKRQKNISRSTYVAIRRLAEELSA